MRTSTRFFPRPSMVGFRKPRARIGTGGGAHESISRGRAPALIGRDDPAFDRIEDELSLSPYSELVHQVGPMPFHRSLADRQPATDLPAGLAFRRQLKHLPFARSEQLMRFVSSGLRGRPVVRDDLVRKRIAEVTASSGRFADGSYDLADPASLEDVPGRAAVHRFGTEGRCGMH